MSLSKPLYQSDTLSIYTIGTQTPLSIPLLGSIKAGFPSPALDIEHESIDLNLHVIKHPTATFYARVKGDSMKDRGISDGDLLIIDKSLEPENNKICVCYIDGEFTLKSIKIENGECWLIPANEKFKPIQISAENDLRIFGVVSFVIKAV